VSRKDILLKQYLGNMKNRSWPPHALRKVSLCLRPERISFRDATQEHEELFLPATILADSLLLASCIQQVGASPSRCGVIRERSSDASGGFGNGSIHQVENRWNGVDGSEQTGIHDSAADGEPVVVHVLFFSE